MTLIACKKRQTFTQPNLQKFDTGLGTIIHHTYGCTSPGPAGTLQSALIGTMVVIEDNPSSGPNPYSVPYLVMSHDGTRWRATTVYMYDGRSRRYHYCDSQAVRKGVLARRAAAAAS